MIQITTTGHSPVRFINENSLVLDTFKPHFYFDFQGFIIPKKGFIMNNKQKSNKNCSCKMIKWTKGYVKELEELTEKSISDIKIAQELVKKFNVRFTSMSIKRKRHKLNLFKKVKAVINDSAFYIKVSKKKSGLGFCPAYMPLEIIKIHNIENNDTLILQKNDAIFFSKIIREVRNDRPNDYYNFYIPYKLVSSTRFNTEIIKYIGKLDDFKNNCVLISENNIDVLALLEDKINEKIQVCLHPFNKNKVFVSSGKTSVPIELQRKIKLSEKLLQCLGFFQGEGTKGNPKRIEIVNTDSDLLNLFIDCLKNSLNIKTDQWRARVTYTQKSKNSLLETELKRYWSKKLNIPADNFVKTKWFNGTPDALNGAVQLYFSSYPLREVWINLLRLSHNIILSDKNYAKWFLQGVLAADGCPIFSREKLHGVTVRIENQYEGELYQSAFRAVGISANLSTKHRRVSFYGSNQLQKVSELELFMLHKERNERFKQGLLSRNDKK